MKYAFFLIIALLITGKTFASDDTINQVLTSEKDPLDYSTYETSLSDIPEEQIKSIIKACRLDNLPLETLRHVETALLNALYSKAQKENLGNNIFKNCGYKMVIVKNISLFAKGESIYLFAIAKPGEGAMEAKYFSCTSVPFGFSEGMYFAKYNLYGSSIDHLISENGKKYDFMFAEEVNTQSYFRGNPKEKEVTDTILKMQTPF